MSFTSPLPRKSKAGKVGVLGSTPLPWPAQARFLSERRGRVTPARFSSVSALENRGYDGGEEREQLLPVRLETWVTRYQLHSQKAEKNT